MTDLSRYYDESYPPSIWTPPPPDPPRITSINPTTGVISTPVTITVTGTAFTDQSVIWFGANALTTTYVSATSLTADGTLPATANVYSVNVRDPNGNSNGSPFTVTATAEDEPVSFAAIPVDSVPEEST
jgi:hypothetical protein